jgi:integrase
LVPTLKQQSQFVLQYFQADLANPEYAGVWLPHALARKNPAAPKQFGWQYLFPSMQLSIDPDSKLLRRHHLDESCVRREIKIASRKAAIPKNVTCHTLRHSFRLPRIYWSRVLISARFRNSLATLMCVLPKFIRMSLIVVRVG